MNQPLVLQVVGYKNSGKTTLICEWIKLLTKLGYKVGTVKHDAHDFAIDHEGTDTWRLKESGADIVAITSDRQTAMLETGAVSLMALVERMSRCDIVLAEGFKQERFSKVVLLRSDSDMELLSKIEHVKAVICWPAFNSGHADRIVVNHQQVPLFSLEAATAQQSWLIQWLKDRRREGAM